MDNQTNLQQTNSILKITPYSTTYIKGQSYNFTKPLTLKITYNKRPTPEKGEYKTETIPVTAWSNTLRKLIQIFQPQINEQIQRDSNNFRTIFNTALRQTIGDLRTNTSFSETLFTEPTHIKSSVYKHNQNSMCEIYKDPATDKPVYITAVYSGEVIWVIHALIKVLEPYAPKVEIEYIYRNDNQVVAIQSENKVDLSMQDSDAKSNIYDSLEQRLDQLMQGILDMKQEIREQRKRAI